MAYTSYSDIENEALYFDSFEYELACGSPPPREPPQLNPELAAQGSRSEETLGTLVTDRSIGDTRPLNPEQEQEQDQETRSPWEHSQSRDGQLNQEQLEEAPDEIMFDEEDFNYNPPQEYEPREYPPQPPAPRRQCTG